MTPTDTLPKKLQDQNAFVAFYDTHLQAEQSVVRLQESGFDMKKLSIVAMNFHSTEQVIGYYTVGDRMKEWASFGAFWGGFWGLLFGSATFFIPGIGPLLIAGPFVAMIVAAEGAIAVGGVSALAAALISLGIPKHHTLKYEKAIVAGKYMLVAHGNGAQIERARNILDVHVPKENLHLMETYSTETPR